MIIVVWGSKTNTHHQYPTHEPAPRNIHPASTGSISGKPLVDLKIPLIWGTYGMLAKCGPKTGLHPNSCKELSTLGNSIYEVCSYSRSRGCACNCGDRSFEGCQTNCHCFYRAVRSFQPRYFGLSAAMRCASGVRLSACETWGRSLRVILQLLVTVSLGEIITVLFLSLTLQG